MHDKNVAELKSHESQMVWDYETGCRVKVEINALLFGNLPGSVTIDEVEKLACDLFEQIEKVWDKHSL